jgi:hypothetical protein
MGKNKSASNLVNVIDFNNDRIAFISGSTTLMSISSSGAITTTGVISGSNAASASFALNAGLLNNRNSAEFTSTGSFNSYTSSNDATVTSVAGAALSAVAGVNALAARTSSYTTTSSFNNYTASNNTTMSCVSSTATSAIVGVGALASQTGSYATTGSNTFDGGQYLSSSFNPTGFSTTASLYTDGGLRVTKDAYISGTLYLNNVTVFGTQSISYISSSQLNIGTNLITVNTDTPSIRFGGLAVYDSGSTGLTGSILWDSQNNHWVYSNPSGSSYSGGMFISGPRTSTLGSETGTTSCMLMAGQGGDHITSSMIYHSSTVTCFHGNSYISGSGAACFAGVITGGSDILLTGTNGNLYGGTAAGSATISNVGGQTYAKFFGASHATTPNATAFVNSNSTMLTISSAGVACFASNVCASTISAATEFRLAASFARVATLDAGGGFGGGYNFNWNNASPIHDSTGALSGYGYANDGSIRLYTRSSQAANTAASERIRILNTGVACFACQVYIGTDRLCWTDTTFKTLQVGNGAFNNTSNQTQIVNNIYYDDSSYKYLIAGPANRIIMTTNGEIQLETANSGNPGCVISLNARLVVANTGAVSISCGLIVGSSICTQGNCTFVRAHNYTWMGGSGGDYGSVGYNIGYTSSSATYTYAVTDLASMIRFDSGGFNFLTAPGGTAGNPLSFACRVRILNSGSTIFSCAICLAGANIFMPGAIAGRGSMIEMPNSQTADLLGMPNLSSTFYLSYACNSLVFRNDSGGTMLQMYCNRTVDVGGNLNVGGGISAGGSLNGGPLTTTTQKIKNSAGGFANMVHKVQGAAGSFSQLVICVDLRGAGGYGYIINTGGTGGGIFQSGGGYTNGQINFSHSAPVGSGFTVTCHACTGTDNIIRFVGGGGVHPFASIQMFGSLQQDFDDTNIYIDYR